MISSQLFWTHRVEDRPFSPLFLSIFPLISIALLAHVISDLVLGRVWKTCQIDMANGKSWILYNSISKTQFLQREHNKSTSEWQFAPSNIFILQEKPKYHKNYFFIRPQWVLLFIYHSLATSVLKFCTTRLRAGYPDHCGYVHWTWTLKAHTVWFHCSCVSVFIVHLQEIL